LRRLLLVLILGLLGGGIAAVVVRETASQETITHTSTPPSVVETELVPAAGQTFVDGTIQAFTADGALADPIPMPVTITAVQRGAQSNATIEAAIVGGARKTIYWYAGQPLPISGSGGALDLGAAHVDADPKGVTWSLAGDARSFADGRYRISSSVAIGTSGLATPSDSGVEFTADNHTVLTATPGVVLHLDSPALQVDGPGTLRIAGQLTVQTQAGKRPATSVVMGHGKFRVTITPTPGGASIHAILEGPVT